MLGGVSFLLALILSIYPHNIFQSNKLRKITPSIKEVTHASPILVPTKIAATKITYTYKTEAQLKVPTPTPTTPPSSNQPVQSTSQITTPTTAPTASPKPTVSLQINDPGETKSFSVTLNSGNNLCDNLTEAKNEGKIKSVTMTWYASFNSYYVVEINGYNKNWTFTLNGVQPKVGCSLVKPNPNDTIIWKFG